MHPIPTPRDPPPNAELGAALGALFGGTFLLAALSWVWPPIAGWLQVLLAGLLLWIPGRVLARAALTVDDVGVGLGPWHRTLGVAAAVMAVVFPLFVFGFHVLQTRVLDNRASWSLSALERWDEALENPPEGVCAPERSGEVVAWMAGDGLWLVGPPGARLNVSLDAPPTSGRLVRCDGGRPRTGAAIGATDDSRRRFSPPAGLGVWLSLRDQGSVRARVTVDGVRAAVVVGRYRGGTDDGIVETSRSLWWLASFVIVHLGLVALPEEWFFRGYLQTRLDDRFGTPVSLLGAPLGVGVVLAALAFALLHPILLPGVHRLLVFFPALLFGWIRARTGNIGAAVIVHAGSNLLLAVVSRMYV